MLKPFKREIGFKTALFRNVVVNGVSVYILSFNSVVLSDVCFEQERQFRFATINFYVVFTI